MAETEPLLPPIDLQRKYLVTGGHGFIGSHVAKALFDLGAYVRVADIEPSSRFTEPICSDTLVGNLCDMHFCERAVKGINDVLHFAAYAGDIGTLNGDDDLTVYQTNASLTSNVLIASIRAKVRAFFFASKAPVYPVHPRENANGDILGKPGPWTGETPEPQRHCGLENLVFELLTQRSGDRNIRVQIARLGHVFGPRDAWNNGREKVPVGHLRKALAIRLAGSGPEELETQRNGGQQQSSLFISDCVGAILALLASGYDGVVNIGCDRIVTVGSLADIAVRSAGLQLSSDVVFRPGTDILVGVHTTISDNPSQLAQKVLRGWTPKVPLEEGKVLTGKWLQSEMEKSANGMEGDERYSTLQSMRRSKTVSTAGEDITVAVLLPITSRGSNSPSESLSRLKTFAESLAHTTWRDTHQLGGQRFVVKIYLAINHDDTFLLGKGDDHMSLAEAVLVSQNICNIAVQICRYPADVGAIRGQIAKQAWVDGCDYFVFMGDDFVLKDEGWIRDAHEEFKKIADRAGTPHGFGCVVFTDTSYPGMPTFPIVHHTHLGIFGGDVIPDTITDQAGGPFIHQLYRRWDCSSKLAARISAVNQSVRHRGDRNRWTFSPLDGAIATAEEWLSGHCPAVPRKLMLDVVIPSFRVQFRFLEPMLNLKASPTCHTMFIIIIDDPQSPARAELEARFASRPDVCIHVNDKNLGASATRNRGMKESAAEWIIFLDDDVTPQPDILIETEKVIRANPDAVGFIGNAKFPPADLIFTTAAHISGVTFFWDIAEKMPGETDMPWGVTANLIARRNDDGVEFNLQFPKTGGGEDIDFCRKKRDLWFPEKQQGFLPAPKVLVTHPWWNDGKRSYRRFYMWSKGDGGLIKLYPELCYIDHAPCSGELLLISCIVACVGVPFFLSTGSVFLFVLALHLVIATVVAHVFYDLYRHLYRDADRIKALNSTLSGPKWVVAIAESSLIRIFNECGRVAGLLERGEMDCLGWRFDWFTGRWGDGPRNEDRMNSRQKFALVIVILGILLRTVSY